MKKYHKLMLLLLLTPSVIDKVYASCTKEEIEHFKSIESEYKYTYELNKDTKDYTIIFNSPEPNDYNFGILGDGLKDAKFDFVNQNEFIISNIKSGTYTINIVGVSDTCDDILKTQKLKLSKYNEYSEDPLCEGIEEFVLCQPSYDKEIDYESFVSRVNTYKKNKVDKPLTDNNENSENKIITYIKTNLLKVIGIIIFIVLLIILTIITIKSTKKSRRLE